MHLQSQQLGCFVPEDSEPPQGTLFMLEAKAIVQVKVKAEAKAQEQSPVKVAAKAKVKAGVKVKANAKNGGDKRSYK